MDDLLLGVCEAARAAGMRMLNAGEVRVREKEGHANFVTNLDEAVQAQRVVVMHQGNVLMDGTPREIFTQVDTLRAASLTVPQTIEVLYDLDREDGETLPIDALSITECADILEQYLA